VRGRPAEHTVCTEATTLPEKPTVDEELIVLLVAVLALHPVVTAGVGGVVCTKEVRGMGSPGLDLRAGISKGAQGGRLAGRMNAGAFGNETVWAVVAQGLVCEAEAEAVVFPLR